MQCEIGFMQNPEGNCIRIGNICGLGLPGNRLPQGGSLTIGASTSNSTPLLDGIASRVGQGGDSTGTDVLGFAGAALQGEALNAVSDIAAGQAPPLAIWGQAHGSRTNVTGHGDQNFGADLPGGLIGFDVRPDSRTLIGAAFDFNQLTAQSEAGDKATVTSRQLAVYARRRWGKFFASGAMFGGVNDGNVQSVQNPVPNVFVAEVLSGNFTGHQFGGAFAAGYRIDAGTGTIEPLIGLDYLHAHQDAFTMHSAGALIDTFGAVDADVTRLSLASRLADRIRLSSSTMLRWQAEAGWAHYFGSAPSVTSEVLARLPVTLTAPGLGVDAVFGRLGARLGLGSDTELSIDAQGELRAHETSAGIAIGGKVRF